MVFDMGTKKVPYSLECVEEMMQEKLTLKVDILQVYTINFSEIEFIVNQNKTSSINHLFMVAEP